MRSFRCGVTLARCVSTTGTPARGAAASTAAPSTGAAGAAASAAAGASPATASLIAHLQSRHLVESITHDDLFALTAGGGPRFKLYCGADPSARSLHLGNLLPLMVLLHFMLRGHDVVALVGGATGAVGDPSGRATERAQMAAKERNRNVARIEDQMRVFLARGAEYARSRNFGASTFGAATTVNNASWWASVGVLDFLATYGRHIRVSAMLARDSVQSRLQSQAGLGFNEFAYQVLQAYDFWHLFREHGVNLQVGGNDQWGNITAGVDLISRLAPAAPKAPAPKAPAAATEAAPAAATEAAPAAATEAAPPSPATRAYGLTVPLLTTSTGEKFGKSAGNAVFIDPELTSPFQLYQYFINTPDDMVAKLLRVFTLLPLSTIDGDIAARHAADPGSRVAQRILAREVVDLVHGVGVGDEMAYITRFLFPTPDESFHAVSADQLIANFRRSGVLVQQPYPRHEVKMSALLAQIMGKSKSETRQLIRAGGVYLGLDREKFVDPDDVVLFDADRLIDGKLMLVRAGKQRYWVVEFITS